MAWRGIIVVGFGFLVVLAGCRSAPGSSGEAPAAGTETPSQVATATVRHIDVEGGFYGLVTDDGRKLDPVNLPEEFRKDGLRLEVRFVPVRNQVSIRMWGTPVQIIAIQRIGP